MSAVEDCPVADCETMGECKARSVGMSEYCQSDTGRATIVGYVREASTDLISGQYIVREPLDTHQVALVRLEDLEAEQAAHAETLRRLEHTQTELGEAYAETAAWIDNVIEHSGDSLDDTYARRRDELLARSKGQR